MPIRTFPLLALFLLASTQATASGTLDLRFGDHGIVELHTDCLVPASDDLGLAFTIDRDGNYVLAGNMRCGAEREGSVWRTSPSGTLDATFNGGVTRFTGQGRHFFSVKAQPDGKLVMAGWRLSDGLILGTDVCRTLADGTIDTTFGSGGCRTLDHAGGKKVRLDFAAMDVRDDGRIVVVAKGSFDETSLPDSYIVLRLEADGADDHGFGDAACPACGAVFSHPALATRFSAAAVAIDPATQDIVVAGTLTLDQQQPTVSGVVGVRLQADGAYAHAYPLQDFSALLGGPARAHAESVRIGADGSVFIAGSAELANATPVVAVAKWNGSGTPDATFGDAGRKTYPLGGETFARALALAQQPDGKLLIAVGAFASQQVCRLLRVDATSGALDARFADAGVARLASFNAGLTACRVGGLGVDGRGIVLSGTADRALPGGEDPNPFLLRLEQDALFDNGFE